MGAKGQRRNDLDSIVMFMCVLCVVLCVCVFFLCGGICKEVSSR